MNQLSPLAAADASCFSRIAQGICFIWLSDHLIVFVAKAVDDRGPARCEHLAGRVFLLPARGRKQENSASEMLAARWSAVIDGFRDKHNQMVAQPDEANSLRYP